MTVSEDCATSSDSTVHPSDSGFTTVTGSNSQLSAAGFAVNRQSVGSFSPPVNSAAQLDSTCRLPHTRDCRGLQSAIPERCCTVDLQSKPSVDVPQPVPAAATDTSKMARSADCILWLSGSCGYLQKVVFATFSVICITAKDVEEFQWNFGRYAFLVEPAIYRPIELQHCRFIQEFAEFRSGTSSAAIRLHGILVCSVVILNC